MSNHPNKDPLNLVGQKFASPDSQTGRAYSIDVFSFPDLLESVDPKTLEKVTSVGEVYRYELKLNFKKAGRKLLVVTVTSNDIKDKGVERVQKAVMNHLTTLADNYIIDNRDDELVPWEDAE